MTAYDHFKANLILRTPDPEPAPLELDWEDEEPTKEHPYDPLTLKFSMQVSELP